MTPATNIDALWNEAKVDRRGLVPCVVQDLRSKAVLMVAWVSKEALARTLDTGFATFWSRSRGELWEKGATSGNRMRIVNVRLDCDGDTFLYVVEASGPACHLGNDSCFARRRVGNGWRLDPESLITPTPTGDPKVLADLEKVIEARASGAADGPQSYTKKLLDGGIAMQGAKIKEEAEELTHALGAETSDRVASEAADLLYHVAVALKGRNVPMARVFEVLERRFSVSGIDEKASRKS